MHLESDWEQKTTTQTADHVNIIVNFLTQFEPVLAKLQVILYQKLVLQLNIPQS